MKIISIVILICSLVSCSSQESEQDKENQKIIDNIRKNSKTMIDSLYVDREGYECDLVFDNGEISNNKAFYVNVLNERTKKENIRLYSVDSEDHSKANSGLDVETYKSIGSLYISLTEKEDEIYIGKEVIEVEKVELNPDQGKASIVTYVNLSVDMKSRDIEASKGLKRISAEGTDNLSLEKWFTLENCALEVKKVLRY